MSRSQLKQPRPVADRATAEGLGGASNSDHTANPPTLQGPRCVPHRFITKSAGVMSHTADGRLLVFVWRQEAERWAQQHYSGMWAMRNAFSDELAGAVVQRRRER
jgi:hypothetical protein